MTGRNHCCDVDGDLLREDLNAAALELAANGFTALWHARRPTLDELLPGRGELADDVLVELVRRGRAELDPDGLLLGVHGLTGRATRHGFTHAGRHLTVAFQQGEAVDEAVALWLPTPERTSHLMNDFCASADLFCSIDHLRQGIDVDGSPGRVISLDEAVELGRETWSDVAHVAHVATVHRPEREG